MTARLPAQLCQPAPARDPGPMEKGGREAALGKVQAGVGCSGAGDGSRRRGEVRMSRAYAPTGVMTSSLFLMLKVRALQLCSVKVSTVWL